MRQLVLIILLSSVAVAQPMRMLIPKKAAAGGGGPTLIASDDFNSGGGSWTTGTDLGAPAYTASLVQVLSVGTDAGAYYTSAGSYTDVGVQLQVITASASQRMVAVSLRHSTSARTYYFCSAEGALGASATVRIGKFIAGTYTSITSTTTTVNSGDYLYGQVVGTTIKLFINSTGTPPGTEILSTTDASIASGTVGIVLFNDFGGTGADAQLDNWSYYTP